MFVCSSDYAPEISLFISFSLIDHCPQFGRKAILLLSDNLREQLGAVTVGGQL